MKKVILIIAVLALTFALTGCDFSKQSYNDELKTCDTIRIRTSYSSLSYSCSDLESVEVLSSGILEIIDNNGHIYLESGNWHITISHNQEEDN